MRRVLLPPPGLGPAAVVALVLAGVVGTLLALAAPAWAHTRLVSSTPVAGVPAAAPGEVVLAFSEAVQPGLSAVRVTGPDGEQHATGSPVPAGNGTSVSQALRAPLRPGTYVVAYRVLAADGHPVSGSFEIAAAAAPPAAGPSAGASSAPAPVGATTGPLTPAAGVRDDGGSPPLVPLAVAGLLVAGVAGLLARRLGGAPPSA